MPKGNSSLRQSTKNSALRDSIDLLKLGNSDNLVMEALIKDYGYSLNGARNIVKEARIRGGLTA